MARVCRKDKNGQVVCRDEKEEEGGLFGGVSPSKPPSHRPVNPSSTPQRTYPRPVQIQPQQPRQVAGSFNIPPKAIIEQTQYGEVEKVICKKDKKNRKLKCKVITE